MAEFFKIYFNQKINLNLAKCRCRWNENAREIRRLWLYSNRRNLISTNLTFLFIGHWEQTMNFHCLKKIEWVATLLPSVIRSSYCFEMVARIMWLYKTSNIAQVRTSYKFFLNELPPIETWQFYAIRGCPVSRDEIFWPWSFSSKPLQFKGLLTAKPSRKSCTCCSFEESCFFPLCFSSF